MVHLVQSALKDGLAKQDCTITRRLMAQKIFGPRKQRTRQHVIADQSVNHVERFIIDEGHTAQRITTDYGYDMLMMTYDEQGYAEPGVVLLQLKASDSLTRAGAAFVFDLDIRDYN